MIGYLIFIYRPLVFRASFNCCLVKKNVELDTIWEVYSLIRNKLVFLDLDNSFSASFI